MYLGLKIFYASQSGKQLCYRTLQQRIPCLIPACLFVVFLNDDTPFEKLTLKMIEYEG